MENKFGITGYCTKETKYSKLLIIICLLIFSLIISLIVSLISSSIILLVPYICQLEIFWQFYKIVFFLPFVCVFILIISNLQNIKECLVDINEKRLYVFFKDEESQNSYDKNRYKFEEIINFLLAENIKPINKDNNLSDIYSISYEIDNERINFYNKLKDKYKIVNF